MPEVDSVAGALRRVQAHETEGGPFVKGKVSWRLVTVVYTTVCTCGQAFSTSWAGEEVLQCWEEERILLMSDLES